MIGLSTYFPVVEIGEPKPGEVVFVSGAAGAVGSLAGQLFKAFGCRVIGEKGRNFSQTPFACSTVTNIRCISLSLEHAPGSAGSAEKVEGLKSLGFDAAFNYKTTSTAQGLQEVRGP